MKCSILIELLIYIAHRTYITTIYQKASILQANDQTLQIVSCWIIILLFANGKYNIHTIYNFY